MLRGSLADNPASQENPARVRYYAGATSPRRARMSLRRSPTIHDTKSNLLASRSISQNDESAQESESIASNLLLHQVSAGDPTAVREFISRFGGLIWSLARRVGLSDAESEDAVQEVFAEIWKNGYKYDPSIASETAFIATIARRRLIDRRRRVSRQSVRQTISEELPPAAPPSGKPRNEIVEEAVKATEALTQLSVEQQRVLRLSIYEGLSHELISVSTGLPLGTVKTHARRGLIKLRELLAGVSAKGDSQ